MVFILRTIFWFAVVLAFWPEHEPNRIKTEKIAQDSAPVVTTYLAESAQKFVAFTVTDTAFSPADLLILRPSLMPDADHETDLHPAARPSKPAAKPLPTPRPH